MVLPESQSTSSFCWLVNHVASCLLLCFLFSRCVALASSTASTTDNGTAKNFSDRNRNNNNNNNNRRRNNNNNNASNNASNSNNYYKRGPGGGSAGGGMPALKLENPMKVVHIVKTPPPQQERVERDDSNRGGAGRGGGGGQDRRQGGGAGQDRRQGGGDRRQGGGGNGGQGGGGRGRGPVASVGTDTSSSPGTRPKGTTDVNSGGEDYGDYSSEAEDGPSGGKDFILFFNDAQSFFCLKQRKTVKKQLCQIIIKKFIYSFYYQNQF